MRTALRLKSKRLSISLPCPCVAPLQLLHKPDDCEDIGVFEDLGRYLALGAQALAAGSLVVVAFSVGSEHSTGLDLDLLRALLDKGPEVLAAQEKKCVEPKFGVVLPMIYVDKGLLEQVERSGHIRFFCRRG